jgi:putative toxin-antitoxin system antitoxin component (TIGR02293 family)
VPTGYRATREAILVPVDTSRADGRHRALLDSDAGSPEELRTWLGLSQTEFAASLGVTRRTVARWSAKPADRPSHRTKTWRALSLLYRLRFLLDALLGREEAARWLRTPNAAFEGRRPLDLVLSDEGERVADALDIVASGGEY